MIYKGILLFTLVGFAIVNRKTFVRTQTLAICYTFSSPDVNVFINVHTNSLRHSRVIVTLTFTRNVRKKNSPVTPRWKAFAVKMSQSGYDKKCCEPLLKCVIIYYFALELRRSR